MSFIGGTQNAERCVFTYCREWYGLACAIELATRARVAACEWQSFPKIPQEFDCFWWNQSEVTSLFMFLTCVSVVSQPKHTRTARKLIRLFCHSLDPNSGFRGQKNLLMHLCAPQWWHRLASQRCTTMRAFCASRVHRHVSPRIACASSDTAAMHEMFFMVFFARFFQPL